VNYIGKWEGLHCGKKLLKAFYYRMSPLILNNDQQNDIISIYTYAIVIMADQEQIPGLLEVLRSSGSPFANYLGNRIATFNIPQLPLIPGDNFQPQLVDVLLFNAAKGKVQTSLVSMGEKTLAACLFSPQPKSFGPNSVGRAWGTAHGVELPLHHKQKIGLGTLMGGENSLPIIGQTIDPAQIRFLDVYESRATEFETMVRTMMEIIGDSLPTHNSIPLSNLLPTEPTVPLKF
jgi:hypothetical protein